MLRLMTTLIILAFFVLSGCGSSSPPPKHEPQVNLTVQFTDAGWDGKVIPVDGRCRDCGGRGRSPKMRIGGLPAEANEVIVEFNDRRITDLARNGGHGALGMETGGLEEVVLPSVREETMSLPAGVRCVSKHRCVFYGHKAGAFKAPCGCGQGNDYWATVKAVRRDGDRTKVLAKIEIPLGLF